MGYPTVLLIGLDSDLHLDKAVLELQRRGLDFTRIDPERINRSNTRISFQICNDKVASTIVTYSGIVHTDLITGVWCRYAIDSMASSQNDKIEAFSEEEFLVAFKGSLLQIPFARWINDPFAEARADNKPHQLSLAVACGLHVQPTVVSQRRFELVEFFNENGVCVIKPLGDFPIIERRNDEFFGSFAAMLDGSALAGATWDETCPVLLQRYVEKDADIRVTTIDGKSFAARLDNVSFEKTEIDIRNADSVITTELILTRDMKFKIANLLKRLQIRFASCDFCLAGSQLYFLEANVSGNYLWTELEAGLPITSAIVDGLVAMKNSLAEVV